MLYGLLAVTCVIGFVFVSALCAELRAENRRSIEKIKYLEGVLSKK